MWMITDDQGATKSDECPVAYTSKCTLQSEESYTPFLLEFTTLHFALNKFDSTIFGQPLEIVMDCQALCDFPSNDNLATAHMRWKNSIVMRNIVSIKHHAGTENQADGLSRKWGEGQTTSGEGEDTEVSPDWEENKGTTNDLFTILTEDGEM
ncbi:hypothetical protein K439DRAFT_1615765 [Ramaria rubella]|nr:hypothetical protein K439DRAFT_1615765 [Ramaria rubella]